MAKAFKAFQADERAQAIIARTAIDIRAAFPPVYQDSAQMSAAYAVRLEQSLDAPVQVVSGALMIRGMRVLGHELPSRQSSNGGSAAPTQSDHMWVMIGDLIADIALFPIAYSADGPPALAHHVHLTFGEGKALYAARWRETRKAGLTYEPRHVLRPAEVTTLMQSAYATIEGFRDGGSKGQQLT